MTIYIRIELTLEMSESKDQTKEELKGPSPLVGQGGKAILSARPSFSHRKTILHGQSDSFRPRTDSYFGIAGYTGCDLCGKYDGYYSIVTEKGSVLNQVSNIWRYDLDNFIYDTYLFCGECSIAAGISNYQYRDSNGARYTVVDKHDHKMDKTSACADPWPKPSKRGQKAIRLLDSMRTRQAKRLQWEEEQAEKKKQFGWQFDCTSDDDEYHSPPLTPKSDNDVSDSEKEEEKDSLDVLNLEFLFV